MPRNGNWGADLATENEGLAAQRWKNRKALLGHSLSACFIWSLTGITDQMLRGQPRPEEVMPSLQKFVRGLPIDARALSDSLAPRKRGEG